MEIRKRQAHKTSISEGKEQNSYQNPMIKFSACRLNHDKIYLHLFSGLSTFISRYSYFHDNKRHIENESRFRYTTHASGYMRPRMNNNNKKKGIN